MYRLRGIQTVLPVALMTTNYNLTSHCDENREAKGEALLATARRLQYGLNPDNLKMMKSKKESANDVKMFYPKDNFGRFNSKGLSVARVATTEIKCNYKEIVSFWLNQSKRNEWDSKCSAVLPINTDGIAESQLVHFVEKPTFGYSLVPSRDYVIEVFQPQPGAIVGVENYTSLAFVNIDASKEVPNSWFYVRGKQNSVLLLEPKGEHSTKVTFLIEKDQGGWAYMSSGITNLVVGNSPVAILSDMKRILEFKNEDSDNSLSIIDIAQKRFKEKINKEENIKKGDSVIDDLLKTENSNKKLQDTIKILELKLKKFKKSAYDEKIDLSELISRIEKDLKKAKIQFNQIKKSS